MAEVALREGAAVQEALLRNKIHAALCEGPVSGLARAAWAQQQSPPQKKRPQHAYRDWRAWEHML